MGYVNRSRFEWGGTESFETSLSAMAWTPADRTVGGAERSTAGVPAAFIVRRDALLDLTLRITEDEWLDFLAFVTAAQAGIPITWFPDADEPSLTFTVFLDAPDVGSQWNPERDDSFLFVFTAAITLRSSPAQVPVWREYFAEAVS